MWSLTGAAYTTGNMPRPGSFPIAGMAAAKPFRRQHDGERYLGIGVGESSSPAQPLHALGHLRSASLMLHWGNQVPVNRGLTPKPSVPELLGARPDTGWNKAIR